MREVDRIRRDLSVRIATILPVTMGALAFIVVSFLAETWEHVRPEMQHQAFVVVNASGAHFILSMLIAVPFALVSRSINSWVASVSSSLGLFVYSYWALLIQHKGLTDVLLSERWDSVFPFSGYVLPLLYGPNSEQMFYILPLCLGWSVGLGSVVILYAVNLPLRLIKANTR